MSKNNKKLSKKQLLDIAFSATIATGMLVNQGLPIALALDERTGEEEVIKNKILGHFLSNGGYDKVTGTAHYSFSASLDEGYTIKCEETGETLQGVDEGVEIFEYLFDTKENGTFTFNVYDAAGKLVDDTEYILEVDCIDADAINTDIGYYDGIIYITLENESSRKFEVSAKYKQTEDGEESSVDIQKDNDANPEEGLIYENYRINVNKNGYYSVTVKNQRGETKTETIHVTDLKDNAPVISNFTKTEIESYREYSVSFDVTDEDSDINDILVVLYRDGNAVDMSKNGESTKKFNITENGKYKIVAEDEAFHKTEYTFEVTEIDNEAPVVDIKVDSDGKKGYAYIDVYVKNEPNGYVIDMIGIDKENITVDDKDKTHTRALVNYNGTYYVVVSDFAGHITQKEVVIDNIPDVPEDIMIIPVYDATPTKEDVTVTFEYDSPYVRNLTILNSDGYQLIMNNNTVKVPNSGTYYIQYTDSRTGNTFKIPFVINNIDIDAPVVSWEFLPQENPTYQQVKLHILEPNLEYVKVTDDSGKVYYPDTDGIYTFYENGAYNVVAEDVVGNITSRYISVASITDDIPNLDFDIKLDYELSDKPFDVNVSVVDSDDAKIYVNDEYIGNNNITYTISKNGRYSFTAEDVKSGRKVVREIDVNSIVEVEDTITFTYDDAKTNQDVQVMFSITNRDRYDNITAMLDGEIIPVVDDSVFVTHNGTLSIIAIDSKTGANISNAIDIDNINKNPIDVTINYDKNPSTGFDMTFEFSDDRNYQISVNGEEVIGDTYRVTENGTYDIYISDEYGNTYEESIVIDNIELHYANILGIEVPNYKTNQNINGYSLVETTDELVYSLINEDTHESLDVIVEDELDSENVKRVKFEITENGNYILQVTNEEHAISQYQRFTVDCINKEKPELNIDWSETEMAVSEVTATVSVGNKESFTIYLNGIAQQTSVITIRQNGTYTISVVDEYGNETSETVVISNIENDAIYILGTEVSTTGKTNTDVTVLVKYQTPNGVTIDSAIAVDSNENQYEMKKSDVEQNAFEFKAPVNSSYEIILTASNGKTASDTVVIDNIFKGPIEFDYNIPEKIVVEGEELNIPLTPKASVEGNLYSFYELSENGDANNPDDWKLLLGGVKADEVFNFSVYKNGTYTIKVVDSYGNIVVKQFNVNNFVTDDVKFIINYDKTPTNKDVEVSYTIDTDLVYEHYVLGPDSNKIPVTDGKFMATKNGNYQIVVTYMVGSEKKEVIKTFSITNINKELPEVEVTQMPDAILEKVALGISVKNKQEGEYTITVNGSELTGNTFLATANGEYVIVVKDIYGNTTTKTVVVDSIVENKLTFKATVENTEKTNKDVLINFDIWSSKKLDYVVTALLPNGEEVKSDNATFFYASENGEYTFTVEDTEGNIAVAKVNITNINKETPVIKDNYSSPLDKPVNKPITGTFKVENKDKYIISMKDENGHYVTPSFISSDSTIDPGFSYGDYFIEGIESAVAFTFDKNGTYTLKVVDEYGNETVKEIVINNIDMEKPDLKVDVDLKNTAKEIIAKVSVSNEKEFKYIFKDITNNKEKEYTQDTESFTITADGKYAIVAIDAAGNETVYEFEVGNIDNEDAELKVSYDKSLTNKDVNATFTVKDESSTETKVYYFKKEPFKAGMSVKDVEKFLADKKDNLIGVTSEIKDGIVNGKFTMTDSGYYLVYTNEKLDNDSYQLIKVDNINKVLPEIKLTPSDTKWTTDNIEVNIDVTNKDKGDYTIYFNGVKIDNDFLVQNNGTYKVTVVDKYGNKATKSIEIKNIDKQGPIVAVSYKSSYTNKDLVINVTALDSLSGLKSLTVKGKNGKEYKIENNQIVLGRNDTITVTAIDKLGNKTTEKYEITNIDKDAPKLSIKYSDDELNSKNIPVTLNVKEANPYSIYVNDKKIKGTVFYASKNGKYSVKVIDEAGNITEKSFSIRNLDKKGPVLSIKYDDKLTDKPIEVTYEAKDESGIASVRVNGKKVTDGKFTIDKNGTYTIKATDKSGNVFSQTLHITNIDTEPPVIKEVKAYMDKLKTYISIDAKDDASGIKSVKINGVDVTKIKDRIRVYTDGLYIIEVTDNFDRTTKEMFEITGVRLKKYLPTRHEGKKGGEVIDTGKEPANPDKDENATGDNNGKEIINNTDKIVFGSSTYTITPKPADYAATNQDLLSWYKVQAPDGYGIDFNTTNVNYSVIGDYNIPVTISAPDGAVLNHQVVLKVAENKGVTIIKKEDQTDGIFDKIGKFFDNEMTKLVVKIVGIGTAIAATGAFAYYAFVESKKRQEANMQNVLIVINGKPFTVDRIKRTINGNELKEHLIKDVLTEYFKNTKERIRITSIVPVDEDMFSVSEKAMASKKDCTKIIYVTYEIKRDLR